MGKVRVARIAQLRAVGLHRIDIGAIERVFVGARVVALDKLDQLELPHHSEFVQIPSRLPGRDRRGGAKLIGAAAGLFDILPASEILVKVTGSSGAGLSTRLTSSSAPRMST